MVGLDTLGTVLDESQEFRMKIGPILLLLLHEISLQKGCVVRIESSEHFLPKLASNDLIPPQTNHCSSMYSVLSSPTGPYSGAVPLSLSPGLLAGRNLLNCASNDTASLGHVLLGNVQRRNEPQGVVDGRGQDEHILLHTLGLDLGREPLASDKLTRQHQTQPPDVVDHMGKLFLHSLQHVHHLLAPHVDVVQDLFLLEGLSHGDASRTGNGIAGVGAAHGPGLLRVHQLLSRDDAGQREAVGDALGHDQDVRAHAVVLDGEHLARAAEAGLHLVGDEQDVVLVADLAHALQVRRHHGDVAALAEDGLDEDGGRVGRRRLAQQQQFELLDGVHAAVVGAVLAVAAAFGDGALGAVGERHGEDARHQRRIVLAVDGLGARHGHGAKGAAVVRALHDDDVLLLGRVARQLDRRLDGFGARVPEEERVQRLVRHDRHQRPHEVEVRLLERNVDLRVHHLAHLRLRRFGDARVTVAQVRDADAAGEVEHLASARHGHVAAGAALDHLRRQPPDASRDMAGAELCQFGEAHGALCIPGGGP